MDSATFFGERNLVFLVQWSYEKASFPAGSSATCTLQENLKRRKNGHLTLVQMHQQDGTESKQVPALIPLLRLQMTPENSNYLVFLLKELTEASLATSN